MYTIVYNLTEAADPECYGEFATLEEAVAALTSVLIGREDDAQYLSVEELRPLDELRL